MNRRAWLGVGGALAVAAGAGGFLLHRSRENPAVADLWALELDTPAGQRLALASLRGKPLVLNFWATWCPPCVREMPVLDRFFREQAGRGWQVLGIAADNPAAVREYLARSPVGYPVAMAGFAAVDLSRRLGNLSGGLPFTLLFDRTGALRQRHTGELRAEDLSAWAQQFS